METQNCTLAEPAGTCTLSSVRKKFSTYTAQLGESAITFPENFNRIFWPGEVLNSVLRETNLTLWMVAAFRFFFVSTQNSSIRRVGG